MCKRFADQSVSSHVHHRFNRMFREYATQGFPIQQVRFYEGCRWANRVSMAIDQIVVHDWLVAGIDQFLSDHAADITRPAGDQNSHQLISLSVLI